MQFQDFALRKEIQDAVVKAGYREPSPIQEQAIPVLLSGRDMIACAQTGTGKTAAFALPILQLLGNARERRIRALILTPTRELAIQIFENFKLYGRYLRLRAVCVFGGVKPGPQLSELSQGCDILVATPGRLLDYLGEGLLSLRDVELLVLDEADRMLDMGFIGSVRKIAGMTGQERQTLLFSATMPREIEQLAQELLRDPVSIRIAPVTEPVDTVKQSLCYTVKAEKKHILAVLLSREGVKKSIVFTRTKHGADRLARDLEKAGIHALSIHGDKTQGQRQNALERFKSGNIRVLIATDLASRGIDVPKLSHVFNYELPEDPESYIHRIGRSGRAGAVGEAVSLCCEEELERLYDIERMMKRELPLLEIAGSIPLVRLSKGGNAAGKKAGMAAKAERQQGKGTPAGAVPAERGRRGSAGKKSGGKAGRRASEKAQRLRSAEASHSISHRSVRGTMARRSG